MTGADREVGTDLPRARHASALVRGRPFLRHGQHNHCAEKSTLGDLLRGNGDHTIQFSSIAAMTRSHREHGQAIQALPHPHRSLISIHAPPNRVASTQVTSITSELTAWKRVSGIRKPDSYSSRSDCCKVLAKTGISTARVIHNSQLRGRISRFQRRRSSRNL